ncbi:unnamed protein product [Vitrella brassicaformis CCMP3155]|uniref:Uncharacterized protein n=1 Tax=Vitrella brassicaformis (strain CCMP3155) TaxID=1169540 RepID=A0A0G4EXW8_VITBC|nr:unnamed protein product [Vitrella brassicaformis CCMP3155]|eukprot:CEM03459.1 unnamed protein product [Vitrella brassicaformis CCMP3155]
MLPGLLEGVGAVLWSAEVYHTSDAGNSTGNAGSDIHDAPAALPEDEEGLTAWSLAFWSTAWTCVLLMLVAVVLLSLLAAAIAVLLRCLQGRSSVIGVPAFFLGQTSFEWLLMAAHHLLYFSLLAFGPAHATLATADTSSRGEVLTALAKDLISPLVCHDDGGLRLWFVICILLRAVWASMVWLFHPDTAMGVAVALALYHSARAIQAVMGRQWGVGEKRPAGGIGASHTEDKPSNGRVHFLAKWWWPIAVGGVLCVPVAHMWGGSLPAWLTPKADGPTWAADGIESLSLPRVEGSWWAGVVPAAVILFAGSAMVALKCPVRRHHQKVAPVEVEGDCPVPAEEDSPGEYADCVSPPMTPYGTPFSGSEGRSETTSEHIDLPLIPPLPLQRLMPPPPPPVHCLKRLPHPMDYREPSGVCDTASTQLDELLYSDGPDGDGY